MRIEKFNGRGKALIRAAQNEMINGVEYQEGDILAFIDNVDVSLGYKADVKNATTDVKQLTNVNYSPDSLHLSQVMNTESIRNLLYSEEKTASSLSFIRQYEEIVSGEIFLNTNRSILEIKTFSEGKRIEVSYDPAKKSIMLDKTYKDLEIFIFTDQIATQFTLKKPEYGYVNILIVIEGKFGDKGGEFSLEIPKASLITDPTFAISDNSYGTDLVFSIIGSRLSKEPVVSYIGED